MSGNEKLSCKYIFVTEHPQKPEDFYEKYFSDFRIFTAKHEMKRKNSKILDIKVEYNGIKWPVEKINMMNVKNVTTLYLHWIHTGEKLFVNAAGAWKTMLI